jgi:hypothetical protein
MLWSNGENVFKGGKIGVTILNQGFLGAIFNMSVHYVVHHTNLAI